MMPAAASPKNSREFGDFQTPQALAMAATNLLLRLDITADSIIEPTCGVGAFVEAAGLSFPQARVWGYDINKTHLAKAREVCAPFGSRVQLCEGDFFTVDWSQVWGRLTGRCLIIGNPPWVTSSELGAIESANLPAKSNFQGRKGLDAITGKANFDISEFMLLRYLDWLGETAGTIAVLCKTSVARKILLECWKQERSRIERARIYKINALASFGAAVDACWFVLQCAPDKISTRCEIYSDLESATPESVIGYDSGHIIQNMDAFESCRPLMGADPNYVWRSGIKHDCSKIMELKNDRTGHLNGLGQPVEIEPECIYPLLKSSDIGNSRLTPRLSMIVTQKSVGEPTHPIEKRAPNTWEYLDTHGDYFEKRGSSIYNNKPRFSIFGVGNYTFTPWKIAISGFYKRLNFVKVGPVGGKPVVFDDTVYFLSCASEEEADFVLGLLQSVPATTFYNTMIHWDEKRPITGDILKRLNLRKLADLLGVEEHYERFRKSPEPSVCAAPLKQMA